MSSRREARRKYVAATANGVPADLALGPCVEVWADPKAACPVTSARARWRAARDEWCRAHELMNGDRPDYQHIPPELRDRGPFYRQTEGINP